VHCDACAGSGWIIDSCSFCNHTGKVTQSELIVREKQLEREDEERKRKDAEAATRKIEAERLRTEQAVIAQQQREAEDARRVAILQHYMIVSFEEFAQATHTLWLSRKLQSISPFYEKEAKATAIDAFTSGFIASHQPFFTRYKFPVFHGETLITAGADTYLTTYRLLFKGPDKFYTIPLMDIEKYSFIKSGFLTGKPELSMSGLFGSIRWKGDRLNGLFFIKNKVMHLIRSLSIWETLPPHVHPILGKRIDDILQQPLP
jgi:hypothetical protein